LRHEVLTLSTGLPAASMTKIPTSGSSASCRVSFTTGRRFLFCFRSGGQVDQAVLAIDLRPGMSRMAPGRAAVLRRNSQSVRT
jgi:hypothetical protein